MPTAALLFLPALLALAPSGRGQDPATTPEQPAVESAPGDAADATPAAKLSTEKLEQLVAPIALYPDSLLTQVLMASTYPLEIVEAARWVEKNPGVTGDALDKALQDKTWDPSVKSLCGLPSVLQRLNENLDWTQDLGDAFLGDQAALMDTVQNMRRKALEAGNLETTKEQKVTEQTDKIIVIEAADPKIVYVPTYYPTVVYGSWYYPTYYYRPLYVPPPPGAVFFSFAVGVAWGHAMWGGCRWGWGHTSVNININKHNTFINRTETAARRAELTDRARGGNWQHDPQHRKGVRYADAGTAQRFGSGGGDRVSRDQARGFSPGSRNQATRPQPTPGQRPTPGRQPGTTQRPTTERPATQRPATQRPATERPTTQRPATQQPANQRPASREATPRPQPQRSSTGQRSGGLSGARSPSRDRAASQRGNASRSGGRPAAGGAGRAGGGGRRR